MVYNHSQWWQQYAVSARVAVNLSSNSLVDLVFRLRDMVVSVAVGRRGRIKPLCVHRGTATDMEHSLLSPTEGGHFSHFMKSWRTGTFQWFQRTQVASASVQGTSCYLGIHENSGPQISNKLFPTLPVFPGQLWFSQWVQTSNFCSYFVIIAVVSLSIIAMKRICLLWTSDCMITPIHCFIIVQQLPDFLEKSSTGAREKSWGREGWLILGLSWSCEFSIDYDCRHWGAKIARRESPSP